MNSVLYSLRTDGDQYRITKFVDGNPEGSYLTSETECECPAGHRHTCRHRQMLPQMIAHGICNTHYFMAYDAGGAIVDFNGTPKKLFDELAAVMEPVPEGQHSEVALKALDGEILPPLKSIKIRTGLPPTSWRRL